MNERTWPRTLAVVTVAYNSADVLPGLLDSLEEGLSGAEPYRIVVADNQSSDGSAELAAAHRTRPRVVRTGRNGGYSAGINAALATFGEDVDVLVLNPDIRLHKAAGRRIRVALSAPGVGIAAPRIVHEDGSIVRSIRREPSVLTAWSDAILGGGLGARLGTGEIVGPNPVYRRGGSIEWASGAILGISAQARAAIGKWDESFFLYSEEVDYCRRARAKGFSVFYVPEATAHHIGGDYMQSPPLYALLTANRVRYFRRYNGPLASLGFQAGVAVGEAMRSLTGKRDRAGLSAAISPQRGRQIVPRRSGPATV